MLCFCKLVLLLQRYYRYIDGHCKLIFTVAENLFIFHDLLFEIYADDWFNSLLITHRTNLPLIHISQYI